MIITYEQIAKRAFEIWQKKGEPEGREQEHWIEAEAQLRDENQRLQKGKKVSSKVPEIMKVEKR